VAFDATGALLGVQPFCRNNPCGPVFFDINKAIAKVGATHVWPVPAPQQVLLQRSTSAVHRVWSAMWRRWRGHLPRPGQILR
jgi:hypothetical protein